MGQVSRKGNSKRNYKEGSVDMTTQIYNLLIQRHAMKIK